MTVVKKETMRDMIKLSFGEEVGNSVSHGVMAALYLIAIAPTSIYSFLKGSYTLAIGNSIYCVCMFLMFLGSCIYHSMEFGSSQKYVMRKLDHSFIFLAIAGTYTPVLLYIVGGALGIVLLALEWGLTIGGIIMTSVSKVHHKYLSMVLYLTMGWTAILILPTLISNASIAFLVLIVVGGLFYTCGLFFYAKKFPYAHFVWHIFIILASIAHFIAVVFLI